MILEAGVLRGDKRIDHGGRYFVEIGIHAVARVAEITSHLLAVGSVDNGGEFILRIFKFLNRRHISYHAIIHQHKEHSHENHEGSESNPHPPYKGLDPATIAARGLFICRIVCIRHISSILEAVKLAKNCGLHNTSQKLGQIS